MSVLEVDEDDEALLSVEEDGAGGGWSSGFSPSAGIGFAVWGVGWLSEAVANGPPLWLRMLLNVPRGSFAVKLLALWLARSRMFGRRCSLPT